MGKSDRGGRGSVSEAGRERGNKARSRGGKEGWREEIKKKKVKS